MGQANKNPGALACHSPDMAVPCHVTIESYTDISGFRARLNRGFTEIYGKCGQIA